MSKNKAAKTLIDDISPPYQAILNFNQKRYLKREKPFKILGVGEMDH